MAPLNDLIGDEEEFFEVDEVDEFRLPFKRRRQDWIVVERLESLLRRVARNRKNRTAESLEVLSKGGRESVSPCVVAVNDGGTPDPAIVVDVFRRNAGLHGVGRSCSKEVAIVVDVGDCGGGGAARNENEFLRRGDGGRAIDGRIGRAQDERRPIRTDRPDGAPFFQSSNGLSGDLQRLSVILHDEIHLMGAVLQHNAACVVDLSERGKQQARSSLGDCGITHIRQVANQDGVGRRSVLFAATDERREADAQKGRPELQTKRGASRVRRSAIAMVLAQVSPRGRFDPNGYGPYS